LVPLSQCRTA